MKTQSIIGHTELADKEHLEILESGVDAWNKWRNENLKIKPSLWGVNLDGLNLNNINFRETDLRHATLNGTKLAGAFLNGADLYGAKLRGADLREAELIAAYLYGVDLREANLEDADLSRASLVGMDLRKANFTNCRIHGISAWNLNLEDAIQKNLIISNYKESTITVDNLEVAQFIYLVLNNNKIRDVIDTIGKKAVLILGRFTSERKYILDVIREELRKRGYLPILFDFEKPVTRDLTETISTLAHLSRFIIADITDAKSIPQELQAIVPNLPSVPIQPIIHVSDYVYTMFEHFERYPWVLPLQRYETLNDLMLSLGEKIVKPAELKANELRKL